LFEYHILRIWTRLHIKQVGFWTVLIGDGSNDLHCVIEWQSLAERETIWSAFEADPEWQRAREDSEKSGPLLANIDVVFLKPTAFSAMK
jgi:NIPSNAP